MSEGSGESVKSGLTNEDNCDSSAKDGSVKSGTTDEDNCQVKFTGEVEDSEKDKDEADDGLVSGHEFSGPNNAVSGPNDVVSGHSSVGSVPSEGDYVLR